MARLRTLATACLLPLAAALLAGCMLISGEATTIDVAAGAGNLLTSFVSAEGAETRSLDVGLPNAEVQVIAIVEVESGDLELAVAQPDGAVVFAVAARPNAQVTRSGRVRADDQGRVALRVTARGARNGAYQVFVQP